jgi:rhamnopyranosyl-N-acetylglucosaminyl-diphospho-decaprenol beta-1,3/1,4-galactofuranosyltransferase
MPSIAAVFATMSRSATALACVRALAAQTRPPELVVVADNVSTDETVAELGRLQELAFRLIVHQMDENRGNAGGVQEAMDLAFAEGADAVWILDDDSWPRPEALEALIKEPWDPQVVRHSLQVDPQSDKFTWPLQIADSVQRWSMIDSIEALPNADFTKSRIIWTGALVSREVRQIVGAVNGALFIRGEDEDYPLRIEQAGFTQAAARHSILDHPGPSDIIRWTCFGKHLFFEPGLADWKLYYKIRNMVWLKKRQAGSLHAFAMGMAYLVATAKIDGLHRVALVIEAALDGWKARLGKWRRHV